MDNKKKSWMVSEVLSMLKSHWDTATSPPILKFKVCVSKSDAKAVKA
jgi:hypothetical protein